MKKIDWSPRGDTVICENSAFCCNSNFSQGVCILPHKMHLYLISYCIFYIIIIESGTRYAVDINETGIFYIEDILTYTVSQTF